MDRANLALPEWYCMDNLSRSVLTQQTATNVWGAARLGIPSQGCAHAPRELP